MNTGIELIVEAMQLINLKGLAQTEIIKKSVI